MNSLAATPALIRLILRRERLALPLWTGLISAFVIGAALGLARLYPTLAAQALFARQVSGTPAEVALLGEVLAPTLGGLTAWRVGVSGAVLAALMGLLTVTRHTRGEEEAGRRELLGAAVVGRQAPLTAALVVALGANLALAALVTVGLAALGLDPKGSAALGLGLALSGWVFSALAGVTAQLATSARSAGSLAGGVLAGAYLLRVVGDAAGLTWLPWLSPLGWARFLRPFAGEAWGVLALPLVFTAALIGLAYALSARRDLGGGWLRPRSGPGVGGPALRSPLALAWRLQRGWLLTWTAAFAVLGAVFGGVATSAAGQLPATVRLAGAGNAAPVDLLFTLAFMILGGELAAVFALGALWRLRSEEVGGLADPVLSTPVSRLRWTLSHVVFVALGPAALLIAFGVMAGLASHGVTSTGRLTLAALAYVPGVWVFAGVALALFGLWPRALPLAWAVLVGAALVDLAAELQWAGSLTWLSPLAHIPKLLLGQRDLLPLLGLLGIAALLTALGLLGIGRRDIG